MWPLPVENRTVKFDLIMFLTERNGQLIGRVDYSTDLFEERTISRFVKNFETTLEQLVAQPDLQIEMLEKAIAEQSKSAEQRAQRSWAQ